jgi:AraC-like DNA-binding protein
VPSSYQEQPGRTPFTVVWKRTVGGAEAEHTRILPDGCLDLLWDGRRLLVAGPDPAARWHDSEPGTRYVGLRMFGGLGAASLGVDAHELLSRSVDLVDLVGAREARELVERTAASPGTALQEWVGGRDRRLPSMGPRVLRMARAGLGAAAMADELGCSARQLHRRCLPLFGYGPRRLGRIVRLQQALRRAEAGAPLAEAAAASGYADQAHLSRDVRLLTGTTPRQLLMPPPNS